MRSLILNFALCIALSACASTPAPAPQPSTPPAAQPTAPTAPPRSPLADLLDNAGHANAPDMATVQHAFGAADILRQEGAGALLTYRLDTCALLLVFAADAHNTMRLSEAHAEARHNGAAAPTLDQCATEASARVAVHPPT